MKTLKILLIVLTMTSMLKAQDDDYKGPAKMYVTTFWRQMDMFNKGKGGETQIANAEKALTGTKEKDPSYNTNAMEAELKKWKAGVDEKTNAAKSEEQKAVDTKLGELNYKGPAQNQINGFWQIIKSAPNGKVPEYHVKDLDYYVNKTKEKDPAYNTAEMEAELKKIKDTIKAEKLAAVKNSDGTKSQPEEKLNEDPKSLLEQLFIEANITVGSTGDIPKAPAKIEAYKTKTQKILSIDHTDALISKGKFAKANISGFKASTDREINKIDNDLAQSNKKEYLEYTYYTIQYHLAFWDAAQKVFPEEKSYSEMYQKTMAGANKIGSLDKLSAKAEANMTEQIKNTKMPAAVIKDAVLEKVLTDGFNKAFSSKGAAALKAVLTQDGWTTLRNSLTSVIVGRERSAKVSYKVSDGKCYLLDDYVFIYEEYIGGAFTNRKAVYNGLFGSEMLCENAK